MADNIVISGICASLAVACLGTAILVMTMTRESLMVFPTWRIKPYLQGDSYTPRNISSRKLGLMSLLSSDESVSRKIMLAGAKTTLRQLRRQQLQLAMGLGAVAVFFTLLGGLAGTLNPYATAVMLVVFPFAGILIPDYRLSSAARQRQLQLNQELPDAIELLALAVGAGESLYAALGRIAGRCTQVTGEELTRLMQEINHGKSLSPSLTSWRMRSESEILAHLVDAIVSALERGSPLAEVLREQVADSRAAARNQLLSQGGKKEVWMMIPVVFLILPLTVVFALYPGLVALQMTGI